MTRIVWIVMIGAAITAAGCGDSAVAPELEAGDVIVFSRLVDGNLDIHRMNPDGSGVTRLTNDPADESSPRISPDGTKIAFARDVDGAPDIFVMNLDGSNVVNLTNHPASDDLPVWSPDGRRIAFMRGINFSDVWVMGADGSSPTNLSNDPGSGDQPMAWHGSRILFVRGFNDGRPNNLYTMGPSGTGLTNLTASQYNELFADYSPDGTRIVFDAVNDLWLMTADGSDPTNITNDRTTGDRTPRWSPGGDRLLFEVHGDIFIMNVDGSDRVQITDSRFVDIFPDWGP